MTDKYRTEERVGAPVQPLTRIKEYFCEACLNFIDLDKHLRCEFCHSDRVFRSEGAEPVPVYETQEPPKRVWQEALITAALVLGAIIGLLILSNLPWK